MVEMLNQQAAEYERAALKCQQEWRVMTPLGLLGMALVTPPFAACFLALEAMETASAVRLRVKMLRLRLMCWLAARRDQRAGGGE